ncbi:MAG TPA: SDR family oxidoreductase [Polyangiaceae bacterium]|jgi:putative NADH-flavin reductase|nr:SDR family oxidoreductase [Polyangiaceae bacterium]
MSTLRLFLLGATGRTGRPFLEQAITRGHQVTAFVRSPEKLAGVTGAAVVQGDPRKADQLRAALAGHDAVVSALGHENLGPSTLLGDAAKSTLSAMGETGVRRLIVVSAAMLFEDAGFIAAVLRRTLLRNVAVDLIEMERIVMASELDWTVVRPPRLTEAALTNEYLVADGTIPKDGASFVTSRADVAHFMVEELERNSHVRRIVGMATRK